MSIASNVKFEVGVNYGGREGRAGLDLTTLRLLQATLTLLASEHHAGTLTHLRSVACWMWGLEAFFLVSTPCCAC